METMARETWTDERLDDLSRRVDQGFARVDARFDRIDEKFDQVNEKFERLYRLLFIFCGGLLAAVLGLPERLL